jgi:hypothetical protein
MTSRKYKRYNSKSNSNKTQKMRIMLGGQPQMLKLVQQNVDDQKEPEKELESEREKERHGFLETIGTAAKSAIGKTADFLEDKGARVLGFKKINPEEEEAKLLEPPSEMSQKASELASTASNIASGIANKVNQVGAIIVDELNKNIDGPIKDTVSNAMGRTVEAAEHVLESANEKLDNPQFVEEVAEATKNASNTASKMLDAATPAINEAIDKVSKIGTKVGSKIGEAAVSIALNTAQAIPGPGAFIGFIRAADKLATTGEAIIEAGAETATTFADTLKKTEEAIKKKISETSAVTGRITDNMNRFNQVDNISNISKKMGMGSAANNLMRIASSSSLKKGGKYSRKFRRARRKLSRKLHFKSVDI